MNQTAIDVAVFFAESAQHLAYQMSISERWHFYYTGQVCELDEFGCKFGFFESVLKTRYHGILYCLNIKASISQKNFF